MRDIKFRAWDKVRRIMIGSDYPKNWGDDNEERYGNGCFMDLVGIEEMSKEENFYLMQYTGLKDKNGKETFSDDIVSDGINPAFLVDLWNFPLMALLSEIDFEVIGNIYENPELLNK